MNRAAMGILVMFLFGLGEKPACGQEIHWYHDLPTARKVAREKNLPLFIDVGTVHCYWCKQLDATTFKDAEVARLLGDHFIAVKMDASKDPGWAQSMGISAYPTLVFTSPEGKQLHRENGYTDASRMRGILTRFKPAVTQKDLSSAIPRDGGKNLPSLPPPEALGISVEPVRWVKPELKTNIGNLYSQMRAMDVVAVRVERLPSGYRARIEIPSTPGKTKVLEGHGASENAALAQALAGQNNPR